MANHDIIYVTYADGSFEGNLRPNGFFARHFLGAYQTILLTRKHLEADPIYAPHRAIFDSPTGRGYWAWKPWAILKALDLGKPGDIVIYQDCGFGLRYKSLIRPKKLVEIALAEGFIAGVRAPHYGPNRKWNHRKCIESIGHFGPEYLDAAQIEAVVSIWPVSEQSRRFVSNWLDYCLQLDLIADPDPNTMTSQHADFQEHRYDQAILTNLVIRESAYALNVDTRIASYSKSITMLEIDSRAKTSFGFYWIRRILLLALDFRQAARHRLRQTQKGRSVIAK